MDEELRHTYDEKKKSESRQKENYIQKISESSMKKIDGQISTQKAENVFSDNIHSKELNIHSKDLMLSNDKENKKIIFNEESNSSKLSGKFFSRKDTEQFPKTNQYYNEAKNISSNHNNNVDHSIYFEFEISGIDKIKKVDSEDL